MSEPRQARITHDNDGQARGAAVFLTGLELRELGLEPSTTDVIEYTVEDGEISLSKPEREVLSK